MSHDIHPASYRFGDLTIAAGHPHFAAALAQAHTDKTRPLCTCRPPPGVPMYVCRVAGRHLVKRMPYTGSLHHPDCESYEPPAELSGYGDVAGSAVQEDIDAGLTALKLGFSLRRMGPRSPPVAGDSSASTARTEGSKLSLRATLHLLWERAELNRWTPGMAGKRTWFVVRKHLMEAASSMTAKGLPLTDLLFVPELFSVEHKEAIHTRRAARLASMTAPNNQERRLLLLIGEVKAIEPARYGHRLVVKHLPDLPFLLADDLHQRLLHRFADELALWSAEPSSRLVVIATFGQQATGVVAIEELCLVPTTDQWLPIEHTADAQLLSALTEQRRRFTKGLRYNLADDRPLASVVLVDTAPAPVALYVVSPSASQDQGRALDELIGHSELPAWMWDAGAGGMPPLPEPAFSPVGKASPPSGWPV